MFHKLIEIYISFSFLLLKSCTQKMPADQNGIMNNNLIAK